MEQDIIEESLNGNQFSETQFLKPVMSASELHNTEFSPIQYVVDKFIPNGLAVLAGAPKSGKSILALNIALSAVNGKPLFGIFNTECCDVLYLSLEDGHLRLKNRLDSMAQDYPPSDRLKFITKWNVPDNIDPISSLEGMLLTISKPGLLIIDVLTKFLGMRSKRSYEGEYQFATRIKDIADREKMAILVIHHTVKNVPKDWLTGLYGSSGLTGAADTVMFLEHERGNNFGKLHVTGRDTESLSVELEFDSERCLWECVSCNGDGSLKIGIEQQKILDILRKAEKMMTLDEIVLVSEKQKTNVINLLNKLINSGYIIRIGHGKYQMNGSVLGMKFIGAEKSDEILTI